MLYVILAVLSGCLVITSMAVNAQLAARIGVFRGTLINYGVGLTCTLLVFGIFSTTLKLHIQNLGGVPLWAFWGGCLGVAVVAASNVIIRNVPTVYVTLLNFIGQLMAGIVIDVLITGFISFRKITGVILLAAGIAFNSYMDKINAKGLY